MREIPKKSLAAYLALQALPGAPLYDGDDDKILEYALEDLELYKKAGADAIFIENDGDLPYVKPPLPKKALELVIKISKEIRRRFDGPIGIQILENDYEAAITTAHQANLDFLRIEKFVFAHVGGNGIIEACSGQLLRLRKKLGCEHIKIFADVKKKHCSHGITSDLDITDEVKQAQFFLADGIVVSGKFTGTAPNTEDLKKVRAVTALPIAVGSGMTAENIGTFFPLADMFLVGSTFRKNGDYMERIDPKRLEHFVEAFEKLKSNPLQL